MWAPFTSCLRGTRRGLIRAEAAARGLRGPAGLRLLAGAGPGPAPGVPARREPPPRAPPADTRTSEAGATPLPVAPYSAIFPASVARRRPRPALAAREPAPSPSTSRDRARCSPRRREGVPPTRGAGATRTCWPWQRLREGRARSAEPGAWAARERRTTQPRSEGAGGVGAGPPVASGCPARVPVAARVSCQPVTSQPRPRARGA